MINNNLASIKLHIFINTLLFNASKSWVIKEGGAEIIQLLKDNGAIE